VNGVGFYFRLVSEVILRRTFLDRRACMESTYKLNYEKEQEVRNSPISSLKKPKFRSEIPGATDVEHSAQAHRHSGQG